MNKKKYTGNNILFAILLSLTIVLVAACQQNVAPPATGDVVSPVVTDNNLAIVRIREPIVVTVDTAVNPVRVEAPDTCTDSDGKDDIYNRGTMRGSLDGYTYTFTDNCVGANTLDEYFCKDKTAYVYTAQCPNNYKCADGLCIKIPTPQPVPPVNNTNTTS
jgi:hypothetical protein